MTAAHIATAREALASGVARKDGATLDSQGGELVEHRDGYGDRSWWLERQGEDGTYRIHADGPNDSRVPFIGYPVRDAHTCISCWYGHGHTVDVHTNPKNADQSCLCGCQS